MGALKTDADEGAPAADEVCEQAPAADKEKEKFDPTKLKAASEYKSGATAGTLYGKSQTDSLGSMLKVENTKGTVSWKAGGKLMADEDAYKALDDRYAKRNEVAKDKVTDNQKELLEIARKAARDADYFNQVINNSETAQRRRRLDYANAQLSNDAFTFSSVLKHRIGQPPRSSWSPWASTPRRAQAWRTSSIARTVLWPTSGAQTLHHAGQEQGRHHDQFHDHVGDASYQNGDIIKDKDNLRPGQKSAGRMRRARRPRMPPRWTRTNLGQHQGLRGHLQLPPATRSSLTSEGYAAGDTSINSNAVGISNHIFGNALDLPTAGFIKAEDQVNDFVAWEFGLQRNVSGETWHFENTGRPTRNAETEGN
ncbi:MAG: hypothetical protein U0176_20950 [Bacteroidia bacterium]